VNALSSVTYSNNAQNLDSANSIHSENIDQVLRGSSILSGGGGGSYQTAIQSYQSLSPEAVEVRNLEYFSDEDNLATIFGLGPVNHTTEDPLTIAQDSVEMYESEYGEIDGVILGEIGPDLVVEAVAVADRLDIPVVNADVAGMRAVPSIQNEIIEGSNVSRTPLTATNGDQTVYINSGSGQEIEEEIRNLTDNDLWYITGYANSPEEYSSAVPQGWLEECLHFEQAEIQSLGTGILESVETSEPNGHTLGRMTIEGEDTIEVYFQNEILLAYRNGEQVAQAPNTISVIDEDGIGVSNGHILEQGETLEIYEISYNFWHNTDCLNLEIQGIEANNETVTFNDTTEFNIQGEQ